MSDRTLRAKRIAYELIEQSQNQFKRMREVKTGEQAAVQVPAPRREKTFEPGPSFHEVFGRIMGKTGQKDVDDGCGGQQRRIHLLPPKDATVNADPAKTNDSPSREGQNKNSNPGVSVFERLSNGGTSSDVQGSKGAVLEDIEKSRDAETQDAGSQERPKRPVSIFEKLSQGSSSKS